MTLFLIEQCLDACLIILPLKGLCPDEHNQPFGAHRTILFYILVTKLFAYCKHPTNKKIVPSYLYSVRLSLFSYSVATTVCGYLHEHRPVVIRNLCNPNCEREEVKSLWEKCMNKNVENRHGTSNAITSSK